MLEMVKRQMKRGVIKTKRIAEAMTKIDRQFFVPNPKKSYDDWPQEIGYKSWIFAPHMHAYTLEWLKHKLKPGAKVLDVGSGSGYQTAVFYEMVRKQDVN